jgi:hypothetical protein
MRSDGVGKGAEFTLELPLQPPRVAPAAPPAAAGLDALPSPGGNGNGNSHAVVSDQEIPDPADATAR